MSQTIAQRRGEDHGLSEANRRHAIGPRGTSSHEITITQDWGFDVHCGKASEVVNAEPKRPMATNLRTIAQLLSSQSCETSAPCRRSVAAYRVKKTTSSPLPTSADPEETDSLLALKEETGNNLPSLFRVDHISPLLLWISQVSNDNIPMSERLLKGERRILERL